MNRFIALIRQRPSEQFTAIDYFTMIPPGDAEAALRGAVADYLRTEDGRADIKHTNGDFNWGDAVMCVPDDIWARHDLRPVKQGETVLIGEITEVTVDQDELLTPNDEGKEELI